MVIDVVLYGGAVTPERVSGRTVAVIDVFRATSVIVEALHNGAKAMVPVVTIEEAMQLCGRYGRERVLLGGERNTVKIEGFDLGNSPSDYSRETVEGRVIVHTTTNGTRAIHNSRHAHQILIAAFLNMSAVCREMAESGRDVVLVCSGREDRFTAEDGLCAGALVDTLVREYGGTTTDIAELLQRMYVDADGNLRNRLSTTMHYNDILERGYLEDIEFCLQRDIYDIVPRYTQRGEVVLSDDSV